MNPDAAARSEKFGSAVAITIGIALLITVSVLAGMRIGGSSEDPTPAAATSQSTSTSSATRSSASSTSSTTRSSTSSTSTTSGTAFRCSSARCHQIDQYYACRIEHSASRSKADEVCGLESDTYWSHSRAREAAELPAPTVTVTRTAEPAPAPTQPPSPRQTQPPSPPYAAGAGMEWTLRGPYASLWTCDQAADQWPSNTSNCFMHDGAAYYWAIRQAAR